MSEINVLDKNGNNIEKLHLPELINKIEVNKGFLHNIITGFLANARLGLACVKGRGEVSGSGKKIYRQKGTGNARHGDKRAIIFRGGGVAFGPRGNTNYSVKINIKERRKALQMVLKQRISEDNLKIADINLDKISTKEFIKVLQNLNLNKEKIAFVITRNDEVINKSARNIKNVNILYSDSLNAYDVLKYKNLLFKKNAFLEVVSKWEKN